MTSVEAAEEGENATVKIDFAYFPTVELDCVCFPAYFEYVVLGLYMIMYFPVLGFPLLLVVEPTV